MDCLDVLNGGGTSNVEEVSLPRGVELPTMVSKNPQPRLAQLPGGSSEQSTEARPASVASSVALSLLRDASGRMTWPPIP
jgi:hypothetical protein